MTEKETIPGAFKALITGYGFFGGWDYAHFPASGVPELSLRGDKPFTGCIGSKSGDGQRTQLAGMVSLGTPKPIMCEIEGEIVTVWESIDIAQNDDM